jgi:hypothetical protein
MDAVEGLLGAIEGHSGASILIVFLIIIGGQIWSALKPSIIKKVESKLSETVVEKDIDLNYEVQQLIHDVMLVAHADRIGIMEFHNGQQSISGIPWLRMSMKYEDCRVGLLPIAEQLQAHHTSLYPVFLKGLFSHEYVILDDNHRDASKADTAYELLVLQEESHSLCVALRDLHGSPMGYVTLKKNTDFSDEDIAEMKSLADTLRGVLHNNLRKK